jgi:hypothetical protein
MREFTKSMVGFTWAVGIFGFQQMSRVLGAAANDNQDAAIAQLDDVSRCAERHLTDQFAQQFRAGDQWQRRLIDVMLDAATLRAMDPRAMAEMVDPRPVLNDMDPRKVFQGGVDMMQKSFDVVRSAVPGAGAPAAR